MRYGDLIRTCNPAQGHWEMNAMLELVEASVFPIDRVLEIGTHQGASARTFALAFARHGLNPEVISVDASGDMILPEHKPFFRFVKGRSQDFETVAEVIGLVGARGVDFLFIDGGHRYHEVKADWDSFKPLVREGGVVGFHDAWVDHEAAPDCDVKQFWLELADQYRTVLIRDNTDGQGGGTGIVFV